MVLGRLWSRPLACPAPIHRKLPLRISARCGGERSQDRTVARTRTRLPVCHASVSPRTRKRELARIRLRWPK
jgi:hypothetical protein